jgi:hypothetical protein
MDMTTSTSKLYWGWITKTTYDNENGVSWAVSTMKRANGRIVSVRQRIQRLGEGIVSPYGTSYRIDHGKVRATKKKVQDLHGDALREWGLSEFSNNKK